MHTVLEKRIAQASNAPDRKRVALFGVPQDLDAIIEAFSKDTIYDIIAVWDPEAGLYNDGSFKITPTPPPNANEFEGQPRPFDIILIAQGEPTERFAQLLDLGYLFEIAFDMLDLNTRFGQTPPVAPPRSIPEIVKPRQIDITPKDWLLDAWKIIDHWKKLDENPDRVANPLRPGTVFVTLCTNSHVAQATVTIESILRFHPSTRILLCLADKVCDSIRYPSEIHPEVTLVEVDQFKIHQFEQFSFQYARYEFCTALKPYCMRYALEKFNADRMIFIDSDTLVCGPFEGIEEILDDHWAIFTPHIVQPSQQADYSGEACILNGGGINSGIVCIRNCETGLDMLNWWCDRMYRFGTSDGKGMHGDQRWLDLLPGLYSGYYILKDVGYNVAHWNLGERALTLKDNTFWINGTVRLRLFHYAMVRLDWESPDLLFHMWGSPAAEPDREIVLMVNLYRMLVYPSFCLKDPQSRPQWAYGLFDNGVPAIDMIRRMYHGLSENLTRFKTPYKTEGPDSFYQWLNTPIIPTNRLTNLFLAIRRARDWETCYPNLDGDRGLKIVMDVLRANYALKIPKVFFEAVATPRNDAALACVN